jgi:hypothetical protein
MEGRHDSWSAPRGKRERNIQDFFSVPSTCQLLSRWITRDRLLKALTIIWWTPQLTFYLLVRSVSSIWVYYLLRKCGEMNFAVQYEYMRSFMSWTLVSSSVKWEYSSCKVLMMMTALWSPILKKQNITFANLKKGKYDNMIHA